MNLAFRSLTRMARSHTHITASRFMKQQLLPTIAANYCSSLQLTELVRAQTRPLYMLAYSELLGALGDSDSDASKIEQDEEGIRLKSKRTLPRISIS
mmetsp:Transcript_3412/g.7091  ORF Transcript_3412/g.7091 Transcript_3412/m.7091 type:complete len:97 (+) Transcript_3412:2-292(+)